MNGKVPGVGKQEDHFAGRRILGKARQPTTRVSIRFSSATFHSGAGPLRAALAGTRYELVHMPAHEAVEAFPFDLEGLRSYDAILLSDIGADSILLHPDVWLGGKTRPNRLKLIRDWVDGGGALGMIGGYLSFQGINGRGRWRNTPVEDVLPVACLPYDDRIEVPEGFAPRLVAMDHPVFEGIEGTWPLLVGANEVKAKPDAEILATLPEEYGGHPLLALGRYGRGRSFAWMSDLSPHWVPAAFHDWPGYARLWTNLLGYLIGINED